MKVFDFDNTIYDGESTVDFLLFCIRDNKKLAIYLPSIIKAGILYKLNLLDVDSLSKTVEKINKGIMQSKEDKDRLVEAFWIKNSKKLKKEILELVSKDDIIITSSPTILMDGIKDKLPVKDIIGSIYNLDKCELEFLCMGENKVKAFLVKYPNQIIDEFYTDSKIDTPFMKLSKRNFLVKGKKIKEIRAIDTRKK